MTLFLTSAVAGLLHPGLSYGGQVFVPTRIYSSSSSIVAVVNGPLVGHAEPVAGVVSVGGCVVGRGRGRGRG